LVATACADDAEEVLRLFEDSPVADRVEGVPFVRRGWQGAKDPDAAQADPEQEVVMNRAVSVQVLLRRDSHWRRGSASSAFRIALPGVISTATQAVQTGTNCYTRQDETADWGVTLAALGTAGLLLSFSSVSRDGKNDRARGGEVIREFGSQCLAESASALHRNESS
jgi:hypothetical protein